MVSTYQVGSTAPQEEIGTKTNHIFNQFQLLNTFTKEMSNMQRVHRPGRTRPLLPASRKDRSRRAQLSQRGQLCKGPEWEKTVNAEEI